VPALWNADDCISHTPKKEQPIMRTLPTSMTLFAFLFSSGAAFSQTPQADMNRGLALFPTAQATCKAMQSGNWSDPATWDDPATVAIEPPPGADGFVWIPPDMCIVQDVDSPRLKKLFIEGCLSPQPNSSVTLTCETIGTSMMGRFWAGSKNNPFTGQWNIVFPDYGPIDTSSDPYMLSRGFMPMGKVELYGSLVAGYCFTTGNKVGDTVVTLTSAAMGWKVGDRLVLPGVGYGTTGSPAVLVNDDDECTIQSISDDLQTITLTAPLKFNHQAVDREGNSRPMFAANISPRSISFSSENTAVRQRGHVMVMRGDLTTLQNFYNVSFMNCGRTDKSFQVSDPDGAGGGLTNPRGRYALHFHRCGPAITGTQAEVLGCFVSTSPGWGFVNHDSNVYCTDSVAYRVYGAHFSCEIGTETGTFTRCAAVRSTAPAPTRDQFSDPAASPRPLADWGFLGHGFWDHCGGVLRLNCIATGMPDAAFVNMGLDFTLNGVTAVFSRSNLPSFYTYKNATLPPRYVPRSDSGLRCFGCNTMLLPWQLNENGASAVIGQSTYSDIRGEVSLRLIMRGYFSGVDFTNVYGVRIGTDYINSTGIIHSGTNSNCNLNNVSLYGFDVAVLAGTANNHMIGSVTHRCLTGVLVTNADNGSRNVAITNVTTLPLSQSDMAYVVAHFAPSSHQVFGVAGPKTQCGVAVTLLQQGSSIYAKSPTDGSNFPQFLQSAYCVVGADSVTLDGMNLYFVEEDPAWRLSNVPNVPAVVKSLTNQQMWDQYKVRIGGRILPADAVASPGNLALQSASFPNLLPDVQVDKWHANRTGLNYQQSNMTSGFMLNVKDSSGNFVPAGPFNLNDKAWNIVPVPIYGTTRGVLVYCDTGKAPIAVW
jgi:hypothetical protein